MPGQHGRSDGTKEEVLNYMQPQSYNPSGQKRPMSAGKKGTVRGKVAAKKKEPSPLKHQSQLIDRQVMESQLARSLQEINTLQVSYFEQARNYITHSHEAASHALIENQEMRAQIAELRKNIEEDEVPSRPHQLLSKHHMNSNKILIKKDADLRNAARENTELRERLQELEEDDFEVLTDVSKDRGSSEGGKRSRPASAVSARSVSPTPVSPARPAPLIPSSALAATPIEVDADLMEQMRLPGQVYAAESFIQDDSSSDEDGAVLKIPPKRNFTSMRDKKTSSVLDMKERMNKMFRKDGNRENPYRESGFFPFIVQHSWFESVSMAAIALNVIWIGLDTMYNSADLLVNADPVFIVIENIFCIFFSGEIWVRLLARKSLCSALRDLSFLFDATLVLFMVVETWILFFIMFGSGEQVQLFDPSVIRMLRLLRLSRAARIVRILRKLPEIMILVKAIGVASRSVFFTMLLLFAVVYVFAIAFVHMAKETRVGNAYFETLTASMYTLFFAGCFFDGLEPTAAALFEESAFLGILLLIYMLFAPLMLMNLLVGVLVSVVAMIADTEQENMDIQFVTEAIEGKLSWSDRDGQEAVTRAEFLDLLDSDEAVAAFVDVGIDVLALAESPDLLFGGEDSMKFTDFMDELLLLRGSNVATLKDLVQARKSMLKDIEDVLDDQLQEVKQGVSKLGKKEKDKRGSFGFGSVRSSMG